MLGPCIGLLIWSLPLALDPTAHRALAIVGLMLVYWMTEVLDYGLTALIGCLLFWLLHVVPSATAFSGFTSPTPWFVFSALLIGQATTKVGLATRLGYYVVTFTGGSYSRLLLGFTTLVFLLSTVLTPMAQVATMAGVAQGIIAAWGLGPHSNLAKGLFLILTYVSTVVIKLFLTGGATIMAAGLLEKLTGVQVLWGQWFLAFCPLIPPSIVACWLILRWLYPLEPTTTPPEPSSVRALLHTLGAWSWEEKKVASWLILAITLWATDSLHHIPPAAVAISVALLLTLPGLGVLNASSIKAVNFLLVLFVGGVLGMANVLAETGILTVLSTHIGSLGGAMLSDAWRATLTLYWGGFLYHFLISSEYTTVSTMLPVLLNVATTQGYNPLVMCMLWVFAGGGKLFVYQNTVLMMGYAYGMFTGKDLLKVGAVLTLVEGLLILLLVPLYWPLIGLSWTSTPAAQHSVQAEAVSVISPPSPGLDAETAAWARVRHATAPQDIIEFLAAFPASPFAFAARMRLRQLQQPPQLAPPAAESGAARRP
jgi:anion transporter